MIILTIRTDNPEAEIGLYENEQQLAYYKWQAHRQLAETIHAKLAALLKDQALGFEDIQAVVAYKGPGSFTGLRIGLSVANAFANGLNVPIVAESGIDWQLKGIERILDGNNEVIAMPEYGALPNITVQKK